MSESLPFCKCGCHRRVLKKEDCFLPEHYTVMKNNIKRIKKIKYFDKYHDNFTQKFRKAVRERDNYTCQICGYKNNHNKGVVAHHINNDKENPCPHLITLCKSCHSKKDIPSSKCMDMLIDRGLINWSKEWLDINIKNWENISKPEPKIIYLIDKLEPPPYTLEEQRERLKGIF